MATCEVEWIEVWYGARGGERIETWNGERGSRSYGMMGRRRTFPKLGKLEVERTKKEKTKSKLTLN